MKIAFNPSTVAALIAPPNNKDITFDLRGHNIFARGVKFCGTDTNTWRDIKINNVSIDSNILDLRDGDNTTLTNINGVVTINSTWRPVVDNLTSDSTTSSLSANLGRILAELINSKSDSGHNHDDRYLRLTGGWMSGDINFGGDNRIYWGRNTDSASISFKNDGDGDADSYMSFVTSDNGNEYFRWSHSSGSTNTEWMALRSDGLRVGGTKVSLEGHSHNDLYYTKTEVNNKLNSKSDTSHTHDDSYLKLTGGTLTGDLYINTNLYGPAVGNNPRNRYDSGLYFFNSNSSTTSTYNFGLYQWNDEFQFTYRTSADNLWKGNSFTIQGSDGQVTFAKTPKVGSALISLNGHTHAYLPLSGGTMTGNIILKGETSTDMTYAGNVHPYIRFDNSDSSLNVSLIFTDYDAYRSPAGIKLVGNQGNEWFEATNIYATNIQTNNIKNLSVGGGIYWNPYVESTTDGSDAASITVVKSGVAGGTTLVLSLMNDANDTILFQTNGSARLYHNSYPILTTLNTYVSNNKGYINGTEITLVNNADMLDGEHGYGYVRTRVNLYTTPNDIAKYVGGYIGMIINNSDGSYPEGKNSGWHHIISMNYNNSPDGSGNDGNYWCSQLINQAGGNKLYIRSRAGGNDITTGWTSWELLARVSDNVASATNTQNIRIDQYASTGEYPIIWADSASSNANSNTISRLYKTWKYLYWTPNKKTLTLAGNGTKCAIGSAFDTNDRPGLHITGNYPELIMMSLNVSNANHGSTIVLGAYTSNSDSETNYRAFAIGMNGPTTNEAFLDFGYGANIPNPHANGIANYGGGSFNNPYIMRLTASKRVFIQGVGDDLKPALLVNTYRNGGWVYTASFLAPNLTSNNNNAIFIGKAHSTCNAFGLTHMHIEDGSVNNYAALEVWGVGNVLRWYYDRHSAFLHRADFSSLGSDASYMNSALLIREHGYNGVQADTWANAPRMSWHWSGRVQTQIGLGSNNELYLSKDNFDNAYKLVYETGTWGINISGNAASATKSEYSRNLLGRSTSGNDYDTNSANLVFAEWNTMNDNRWYLKATGYECRVAFANNASRVYGYVGDTGSHELVRCDMNNDQFRIIAGSSGNNNGWAEIATADDGTEPIYVRQYTGVFSSVVRTLTLLDANGYTHFPSYINIGGNENNNSSPDRVWGSNGSDSYLRSYRTSALNVNYAASAGNADTVDGYHATSGRTFDGNINWSDNWDDVWSDGTHTHPWYGFDHRYPNTGAYSTTISDYFGMTIKTANTLRLDFGTLLLNGTDITNINIASATKLQTPRSIWGQSFDGTRDVNGTIYINNSDSSNGAIRLNNDVNSNARISAISDQVIFNTGSAIRFGETAWDWNQWAGLKYTHSNKTIYLGIADNSIFNANSALGGGTLKLPGITTITPDSGARIGGSGGDLYLGNADNSAWVKVQDMCSQESSSNWVIKQNGEAYFDKILEARGIMYTKPNSNSLGTNFLNWDSSIAANVTNMFNGIPYDNISIEYSRDNGASWATYTSDPSYRFNLVNDNTPKTDFMLGNASTDNRNQLKQNQLRVTIKIPNEIYQELSWISVEVNKDVFIKCQIYLGDSNGNYSESTNKIIKGSSHLCDICVGPLGIKVGNNTHRYVRLVFSHPSITLLRNGIVSKIRGLALTKYNKPGDRYNISTTGHIYDYNYNMAATFPNNITANGLVRANGFYHSSVNSNDYMLLAGGGYSQGVPVRYWAIYYIGIGNHSAIICNKRSGNYNFITSEVWESVGVAMFDISFPSGYNKNNTLIFGNGDHLINPLWENPVYVTITTSTDFNTASQIKVIISNDKDPGTGYANIYFMCMG